LPEVKLDISLEAYIPTEYIADGASRIEIYHDLSAVTDEGSLAELEKGVADRFGPLPKSVNALLLLMRIKFGARKAGISRVSIGDDGSLSLSFEGEPEHVRNKMMAFMQTCGRPVEVNATEQRTVLKTRLSSGERQKRAQEALAIVCR
jgi:transcription-repair coupling factor (superfamily II helicase)